MYPIVLGLHSWLRWFLLIGMVLLLVRSVAGKKSGVYDSTDQTLATATFWLLNIQFIIGLLLYGVLSPVTQAAFANMGEAMSNSALRFYVVEHMFAMVLAIGAGHMGLSKAKKAADAGEKHKWILRGIGASLVCVLVGIPWPFLPYGRALFFF